MDSYNDNGIISMTFSPGSNTLCCIDTNRKLSFLRLHGQMEISKQIEAAYDGQLTSLCYNEARDQVAVGDDTGEIKVFDIKNGKMLHLD